MLKFLLELLVILIAICKNILFVLISVVEYILVARFGWMSFANIKK
jgi:hypothetical protein